MIPIEPRFMLTTIHDKESYRNMVTVHYIVNEKNPTAVLYGAAVALALFFWGGGIFAGQYPTLPLRLISGLCFVGLLCACVPFFERFTIKQVSKRMLKSKLKAAKDVGSEVHMTFTDDDFTVDAPTGTNTRPYRVVTKLCETPGYFLLFEGKDAGYTLDKKGFTLGTAEEFKAFICAKCGAEFQAFAL